MSHNSKTAGTAAQYDATNGTTPVTAAIATRRQIQICETITHLWY